MSDPDIVNRLRTNRETYAPCLFDDAAAEIERLREELTASHESHGNEVGALTERLSLAIHERDEARRELCRHVFLNGGVPPREYARVMKWDCFKEER